MKNLTSLLLVAFWLITLLNLAFVGTHWEPGIFITKPLLMTTLSAWFFFATRNKPSVFSRFILIGLVFSIAGDVFLMFVKPGTEHFFLLGLGSFLIAHLCYITSFIKFPNLNNGIIWHKPGWMIPFLVYLAGLLFCLWKGLPVVFKAPVVTYACVITTMAILCANMKGRTKNVIAGSMLTGALLFVFSDSVIAIQKFMPGMLPFSDAGLLIMTTYVAGQFLLATGSVAANAGT